MDRCDECGFVYDEGEALAAGAAIRTEAGEMAGLLRGGGDLTSRRSPDVWSPLEYGCHLRDVLLTQRERVLLARREDRPSLVPMGRDVRVEHDGYGHQDPEDVARQLDDAALLFANVLGRLDDAGWSRTVIYNYPERTERSLRWVAVHTLHEVVHHLLDARRQLA